MLLKLDGAVGETTAAGWQKTLMMSAFGVLVVTAGDWGAVPYRSLFMAGFFYVACGSLFRRFSMR